MLKDPSIHSIRRVAIEQGSMRTLRQEAFRIVEQGITSIEEVLRVVDTGTHSEESVAA